MTLDDLAGWELVRIEDAYVGKETRIAKYFTEGNQALREVIEYDVVEMTKIYRCGDKFRTMDAGTSRKFVRKRSEVIAVNTKLNPAELEKNYGLVNAPFHDKNILSGGRQSRLLPIQY